MASKLPVFPPGPLLVPLDRPREIAWTRAAQVRYGGLRRARSGSLLQLLSIAWAMLVERDHPFAEPEDLAEHVATREQVNALGEAVLEAQRRAAAADDPKNGQRSTTKPGRSSSSG